MKKHTKPVWLFKLFFFLFGKAHNRMINNLIAGRKLSRSDRIMRIVEKQYCKLFDVFGAK